MTSEDFRTGQLYVADNGGVKQSLLDPRNLAMPKDGVNVTVIPCCTIHGKITPIPEPLDVLHDQVLSDPGIWINYRYRICEWSEWKHNQFTPPYMQRLHESRMFIL